MSFGDAESVQPDYVHQLELEIVENVQRIGELERALRNVLMLARRDRPGLRRDALTHILRVCAEVGIYGDQTNC